MCASAVCVCFFTVQSNFKCGCPTLKCFWNYCSQESLSSSSPGHGRAKAATVVKHLREAKEV